MTPKLALPHAEHHVAHPAMAMDARRVARKAIARRAALKRGAGGWVDLRQ